MLHDGLRLSLPVAWIMRPSFQGTSSKTDVSQRTLENLGVHPLLSNTTCRKALGDTARPGSVDEVPLRADPAAV